jgi:hypothetical protein
VEVRGVAPTGARVVVNDRRAQMSDEAFTCAAPISARRNEITAVARRGAVDTETATTVL